MELGLLYQLFGVKINVTYKIRQRVKLVVLNDGDVKDVGTIAAAIQRKAEEAKEQGELFEAAYKKCAPVLKEAQGVQLLGRWIEDFVTIAASQNHNASYLEEAFFRLMDQEQLGVWAEDPRSWKREKLDVSWNRQLKRLPDLSAFQALRELKCMSCNLKGKRVVSVLLLYC